MKILLNTKYEAGCTVVLRGLCERLQKKGYTVTWNDWNHYEAYDVILFLGNDSKVRQAKASNPRALVGIMCPYVAERWHEEEARAADFLLLDSIEMREIFLAYNKNVFIYYMFPDVPEIPKTHVQKEKIIIGYHGNKVHLNCMGDVSWALDKLSQKYPIELWAMYNKKTLGKWRMNLPKKCPVRHVQWSQENYHKELSQCDIGIVPAKIPINLFFGRLVTRAVSSFIRNWANYDSHDYLIRFKHPTNPGRVYPFSQLHIPVVADFLPSYAQMIHDSHSGYLVYSKEGWYFALERLIQSAELRNQMSAALKEYIDKTCSPDKNVEHFISFLSLLRNKVPII